MSTTLNEMLVTSPTLFTQTKDFKIFMEPFIPQLRNHPDTQRVELTAETKHLYNFSLETLLLSKRIPLEDIWIIMRMNGIEYSHKLDTTLTHLLLPNINQLAEYKGIYKNRLNKT